MANLVRRIKRLNGLEKAYEERDAGFTFLVLFLFKWNKSMTPSATTLRPATEDESGAVSFHLADLMIPPSIIASVAVASVLVQAYTGWSLFISVIVAIIPGAIVGFFLGAFLSLGIGAIFFYFNQDDN